MFMFLLAGIKIPHPPFKGLRIYIPLLAHILLSIEQIFKHPTVLQDANRQRKCPIPLLHPQTARGKAC
jgi:hypothetical protein